MFSWGTVTITGQQGRIPVGGHITVLYLTYTSNAAFLIAPKVHPERLDFLTSVSVALTGSNDPMRPIYETLGKYSCKSDRSTEHIQPNKNCTDPPCCADVFSVFVGNVLECLTSWRHSLNLGLESIKMTTKARKLWSLYYSQAGNKMFTYK